MNNIFVYCEIEEGKVVDVSLELLSKGRKLANEINCQLEAILIGTGIAGIEKQVFPYGVDVAHVADSEGLYPYTTMPHCEIIKGIFKEEQPEIAIFGATSVGRDLAPRVASALRCGLTADCTSLIFGDHTETKSGKEYKNLLYQIRPAFGGNIIATIINPDTRPQMATVREGVMKKEIVSESYQGTVKVVDAKRFVRDTDFAIQIIERHLEARKVNLGASSIIIAGGYGVGSKKNFNHLYDLASAIGGEVGATRAAVDAGYVEHDRQIGQTGFTVRPKLYIACGISGAVQHRAGMDQSSQIISINTDPNAPINAIADYTIIGRVEDILPKMIKYYKQNSK